MLRDFQQRLFPLSLGVVRAASTPATNTNPDLPGSSLGTPTRHNGRLPSDPAQSPAFRVQPQNSSAVQSGSAGETGNQLADLRGSERRLPG